MMPFGDGTGPFGYGPGTGRRAGFCAGYSVPGFMNNFIPRMGYGRRWIYYWRRPYYGPLYTAPYLPPPSGVVNLTKEVQKRILEEEMKDLETRKQEIERRLKELE